MKRNITALYIRVSTDEQADRGHSIEAQENLLIEYCDRNKISEYRLYIDKGHSAKNANRPAYQNVLRDIKNKEA